MKLEIKRGIDNLPDEIKNAIEKRETYPTRVQLEGNYDLTELLYCLRRSYYRRKSPIETTVRQKWQLYRGHIFDSLFTPLFKKNQIRVSHRIPGTKIVVNGKIDYVIGTEKVGELKTTQRIMGVKSIKKPLEEHIKQIAFYCYCSALYKADLVYLDLKDCVTFEIIFTDEDLLDVLGKIEDRAKKLHECVSNNTFPDREEGWMCMGHGDFQCEYIKICVSDSYNALQMKRDHLEKLKLSSEGKVIEKTS